MNISRMKSVRKDPERLFSYKNRVDHSSILQSGIIKNWFYLWIHFISPWMWFNLVHATSSLGSTDWDCIGAPDFNTTRLNSSATCTSTLSKKILIPPKVANLFRNRMSILCVIFGAANGSNSVGLGLVQVYFKLGWSWTWIMYSIISFEIIIRTLYFMPMKV